MDLTRAADTLSPRTPPAAQALDAASAAAESEANAAALTAAAVAAERQRSDMLVARAQRDAAAALTAAQAAAAGREEELRAELLEASAALERVERMRGAAVQLVADGEHTAGGGASCSSSDSGADDAADAYLCNPDVRGPVSGGVSAADDYDNEVCAGCVEHVWCVQSARPVALCVASGL